MGAIDVLTVLKWTLCAVALSPMVLGIGWAFVEGSILPRLIPRSEIERLADELTARYPTTPRARRSGRKRRLGSAPRGKSKESGTASAS